MTILNREDWLTSSATQKVIEALETARAGSARFVGGCVRNALMGRPVDDIDIATQLTPEAVMTALQAAGIRAIPTGIEHGTVTAVCESVPYEITTLRRDVETDGRRAVVAFTEDWKEDAQRRDFRCNALYAEPDGTLHDPVGGGIEDAKLGRVIFIGDADERLREDYLRILRFFRFNAWYGADIDPDGLSACQRQKEGLRHIAAERIWKELHKLLFAKDPCAAVKAMEETGILSEVLPSAETADRLCRRVSLLNDAHIPPDAMHRLMTLIAPTEENAAAVSTSLRLSNAETSRLEAWVEAFQKIGEKPLSDAEIFREFYRFGPDAVTDYLVWRDPALDDMTPAKVTHLFKIAAKWLRPKFPLSGEDALKVGLSGPAIGAALRDLEHGWIESDFSKSRNELLKDLSALA